VLLYYKHFRSMYRSASTLIAKLLSYCDCISRYKIVFSHQICESIYQLWVIFKIVMQHNTVTYEIVLINELLRANFPILAEEAQPWSMVS
jgi:hypothetical protein